MKIAVLISGTIRYSERSLLTLQKLAEQGHELDTFLFTYTNVESSESHHWSRSAKTTKPAAAPQEPTRELLDRYRPTDLLLRDWPTEAACFQQQLEGWQQKGWCEGATRLALLSQFYGIEQVAKLAGFQDPERLCRYDGAIRLRFDGFLGGLPPDVGPGWVIPSNCDFSADDGADVPVLNDRLGLFFANRDEPLWSACMFWGYAGAYSRMERLLAANCSYHPEEVLRFSMLISGAWPSIRRRDLVYSIHRDAMVMCVDADNKKRS